MCTLIALHRCVPEAPLVVAANRDEFFDRPSEGPALRPTSYGVILAPRDARAGGTWLGLNASGLFAALTNRRCAEPDPLRRSRGLLVVEALEAATADEAAEKIESLPTAAYNPFNLLVADRARAWAFTYDEAPTRIPLGPGAHVIGNVDPTAPPPPKLERVARCAERAAAAGAAEALDALAEVCRGHGNGDDSLDDPCVHTPLYGTRSSTLLRLGERDGDGAFRFADGAPCETEYVDVTPLLGRLCRNARLAGGESPVRKIR
jgi:uncharacterized protein with NRDE domain